MSKDETAPSRRAEFEADACVLVTRMAMDVFRRRLIGDSTAG